jgi:hypothetical protein
MNMINVNDADINRTTTTICFIVTVHWDIASFPKAAAQRGSPYVKDYDIHRVSIILLFTSLDENDLYRDGRREPVFPSFPAR